MKCKKSTIDHDIYIKFFCDEILLYLMFYTNGVLNNTNNKTVFTELISVFEEAFDIKV